MSAQNLSGTVPVPSQDAPFRYEATWELQGRAARWRASVWSSKGVLISNPGGLLINASDCNVPEYLEKAIADIVHKVSRSSALGRRGEP